MRTRQLPYEIVVDGSDKGGTSHCIVFLLREMIGFQALAGAAVDEELRPAGKTCCRHRASGFHASKSIGSRRGIPHAVRCLL